MRGNLHVQFLGGWARATAPGYPATLEHLTSATAGFRQRRRFDCGNYWAT